MQRGGSSPRRGALQSDTLLPLLIPGQQLRDADENVREHTHTHTTHRLGKLSKNQVYSDEDLILLISTVAKCASSCLL